ncbi:hypothetical protein Aksp01_00710 [Akkermansia sp. NBRC 115031]|nr:hypothetical protein Aksp01_00710 [Akkermansia sp. NBRC 115031]
MMYLDWAGRALMDDEGGGGQGWRNKGNKNDGPGAGAIIGRYFGGIPPLCGGTRG